MSSCWIPSPAAAELVYTADGRTLYGQVRAGAAAGSLVVDGGDGTAVALHQEEVASIEFRSPAAGGGRPSGAQVTLRNGDRLIGTLRQLWPPAVHRGGSIVVVPPAWVAAVQVKPGPGTGAAGESDVVELSNGDRVEGRVQGVRDGRLQVSAPIGALAIDPNRVRGLVMARGDAPLEPAPGIQAVVETTGGERITGDWLSLAAGEIRLKPSWGAELAVPMAQAARLTVLNGRLVFLSDLRPAETEETAYFDAPHPFRVDRSQGGRPLRLAGRVYARGLGVHARSELTFALAGSFKSFATTVGVDSEVGNGGRVVFRVIGDERPLFESPVLRGGDAPLPVTVDVSGVLLLRLEVEPAGSGDVADHADWAEARLTK